MLYHTNRGNRIILRTASSRFTTKGPLTLLRPLGRHRVTITACFPPTCRTLDIRSCFSISALVDCYEKQRAQNPALCGDQHYFFPPWGVLGRNQHQHTTVGDEKGNCDASQGRTILTANAGPPKTKWVGGKLEEKERKKTQKLHTSDFIPIVCGAEWPWVRYV